LINVDIYLSAALYVLTAIATSRDKIKYTFTRDRN